MRILNIYVFKNLFQTFIGAVSVLIFVMLSGSMLKLLRYVDNSSLGALGGLIGNMMPEALGLTLPVALLISVTLVFSRMSAENEITAMRASGVGIWQIVAPGLVFSLLLSALCFYLHLYAIPSSKLQINNFRKSAGLSNPAAFLEPGIYLPLGVDRKIYIGSRQGNDLENVDIKSLKEGRIVEEISARRGELLPLDETGSFGIRLEDVTILSFKDGKSHKTVQPIYSRFFVYRIDARKKFNERGLRLDDKYLDLDSALARLRVYEEDGVSDVQKSKLLFLINKRLALALSPLAFFLMGMPFGFRTSRSETSAGLVAGLILGVSYFLSILIAESMRKKAALHPEFLVWIPNIVFQVAGIIGLWKISKR